MNEKMQNMVTGKKGSVQLLGMALMILMNPWIWVIIGVFLLGFWFLSLFMLGKIIGCVLIIGTIILMLRGMVNFKMAIFMICIAILVILNPLSWEALSFIR